MQILWWEKIRFFLKIFVVSPDILQPLYNRMPNPEQAILSMKHILQMIVTGFSVVVQPQLHHFLPGGKYHGVDEPGRKEQMAHCKLSNLLGEACFGDLLV